MDGSPQNIGIFGGTFDPVHNGHISVGKSFLSSTYIDELWVLLNPDPPHKPDEEFAPYSARLKMLQAAFSSVDNVLVSDLETNLPSPTYTLQTVSYLSKKYPEHTYYLCIGKDSLVSFTGWHKWRQILEYCTLLVAERPLENGKAVDPELKNHVKFVEHTPVEVSSSEIRRKIKQGETVQESVPYEVLEIIEAEQLYRD